MRIVTQGVRLEWASLVEKAVKIVDSLVWGGRMNEYIDTIFILADSDGIPGHPTILKGIVDVYDSKDRSCTLHLKGLIPNDEKDSMLAWAICHDLSHAFDVAHGNLKFNRETDSLTYMGREYVLRQPAITDLPKNYVPALRNGCQFYECHNHYEPWEVRPLIAADLCMSEIKMNEQAICPNLKVA